MLPAFCPDDASCLTKINTIMFNSSKQNPLSIVNQNILRMWISMSHRKHVFGVHKIKGPSNGKQFRTAKQRASYQNWRGI